MSKLSDKLQHFVTHLEVSRDGHLEYGDKVLGEQSYTAEEGNSTLSAVRQAVEHMIAAAEEQGWKEGFADPLRGLVRTLLNNSDPRRSQPGDTACTLRLADDVSFTLGTSKEGQSSRDWIIARIRNLLENP